MKPTITLFAVVLFFVSNMLAQNLLFEQSYFDGGNAITSALDPAYPLDIEVAENFDLTSGVKAIEEFVFYGLTLKLVSGSWQEQTPNATEPFLIKFYGYSESTSPGLIAPATGNYSVALKDDFGDGWAGDWPASGDMYHTVSVFVNGVAVLNEITLTNGTGPEYHNFSANAADNISTVFTIDGGFAAECYYAILDPDNIIIAEDGGTWNSPGASVPAGILPGGQTLVDEPDWANPVVIQNIVADVIHVGPVWNNTYQLYKFVATFQNPVYFAEEGWVSAQIDAANGSGTWFLWLNSLNGDGQSWQRTVPAKGQAKREVPDLSSLSMKGDGGSNKAQLGFDLAMELWGDPNPPQDTVYSISEVYSIDNLQDGDTIKAVGYYTSPSKAILLESYWDIKTREVLPAQSFVLLDGLHPPYSAFNGGLLIVTGILNYIENPEPYHPNDTVMAIIQVQELDVLISGDGPDPGSKYELPDLNFEQKNREECDPCKFAILISGGVNHRNNHISYWRDLEILYNHKKDNESYCKENIFVHWYHGHDSIPGADVFDTVRVADLASITNSFNEIAQRVALCHSQGKESTFQKLVSNHGRPNGDINLLATNTLTTTALRDFQQQIIDACASTILDEFTQCYGGNAANEMRNLNHRYKARIYSNSAANSTHPTGNLPGQPHSYLQGKINSLASGNSYPRAVVDAKKAYDQYLQNLIDANHAIIDQNIAIIDQIIDFINQPGISDEARQNAIARGNSLINDSNRRLQRIAGWRSRICTSVNISIIPMKNYCDWVEYVIPPGGQLILDFDSDNRTCANVSVYRIDPVTGDTVKVKVWNWNNPRSHRYQPGNQRRVINGSGLQVTTFLVHSDANDRFVITGEVRGNQSLVESPSNAPLYPGFSFGGRDGSANEFADNINVPFYFIEGIDQIPISLSQLPARMGGESVYSFGCSFNINIEDEYWTEMELVIDVAEVFSPGSLTIFSENSPTGFAEILITGPGRYAVPLGNMTFFESPLGSLGMEIPSTSERSGLDFTFDSWGLRTLYEQPLLTVSFIVMDDDDGELLAQALITIDGEEDLVTDENGMAFIQLPDGFYTATASKEGYEANSFYFNVSGNDITEIILLVKAAGQLTLTGEIDGCFDNEDEVVITNAVIEAGAVADIRSGSTITAAQLVLQEGGTAFLSAQDGILLGPDILITPGVGGLFKASIGILEPCGLLVVASEAMVMAEEIPHQVEQDLWFKVFPNPNTGRFTLLMKEVDETVAVAVEIYSMLGERIISTELPAADQYRFDLSARQSGIYLIRVMMGDEVGVEKIIKH